MTNKEILDQIIQDFKFDREDSYVYCVDNIKFSLRYNTLEKFNTARAYSGLFEWNYSFAECRHIMYINNKFLSLRLQKIIKNNGYEVLECIKNYILKKYPFEVEGDPIVLTFNQRSITPNDSEKNEIYLK